MGVYKFTLSSASATVGTATAWQQIPIESDKDGWPGSPHISVQMLSAFANSSATGAAATIAAVLTNGDISTGNTGLYGIIAMLGGSVGVSSDFSSRRTNFANNANNYVCDVSWSSSGTRKLDLTGLGTISDLTTATMNGSPMQLWIGCTDLGGLSSINMWIATTRVT